MRRRTFGSVVQDQEQAGSVKYRTRTATALPKIEELMIGTLLNGRFRLEERVGSGGMSTVYRAFDETLERWVAIKLLQADIRGDDDQIERFRREARAVARLNHPHVVTVIDAGEDDGAPYIVFEYVAGETLKDRIRRMGQRLPITDALAYAIEIARALEAAHAELLVHRDVKPQNVLLDHEGRAKVTDFGIARSLEVEGLTLAGRVLGTTDYVSPEQALGQEVTQQSDIYSLGIVLYEMLTGEVPYKADAPVAVAMKHVREPMPDVRRARREVSAVTASIVERATAKETKNRYRTVAEMREDLEQALGVEAARAGHVGSEATSVLRALPSSTYVPWRLRFPRRAMVLTALLAFVIAAVVIFLAAGTHHSGPRQPSTGAPQQQKGARALINVPLSEASATDYDPIGGDGEHTADVPKALDGDSATAWTTETYSGGLGNKEGVGLYVDAGSGIQARKLDITANPGGYEARVYAAPSGAAPDNIGGWKSVSDLITVDSRDSFAIDTKGRQYQYYLVWISKLPPGGKAGIAELKLWR
jgi:eukaryotic-like serine/threonine-protein kinase